MAAVTQIVISGKDELSGVFRQAAVNMEQSMSKAATAARNLAGGVSAVGNMAARTQAATSAFASLGHSAGAAAAKIDDLRVDLQRTGQSLGLTEAQIRSLSQRMGQAAQTEALSRSLRDISSAAGLSRAEMHSLGRQMGLSAEQIRRVSDASRQASESSRLLSGALRGMGAFFTVSAMTEFARSVVDAGLAMDSLQRSFVAVTGSQEGAAQEFAFLRAEADRLGQSFYDLAPQFRNIAAAAKGTALEGAAIHKVFSAVGNASTALGMSVADTEGVLRALGQMISKGTVQAEELRGQLGERLPGAFQLAARAMGVSTQELGKMLERGEVLSEDLLPKLADELNRAYAAAAETSALESGQAAVNRLSQSWTDFKVNLFDSEKFVWFTNFLRETVEEWDRILFSKPSEASVAESLRGQEAMLLRELSMRRQQLEGLNRQPDTWLNDLFGSGDIAAIEAKIVDLNAKLYDTRKKLADLAPAAKDGLGAVQNAAGEAKNAVQLSAEEMKKGEAALKKYLQTRKEALIEQRDYLLQFAKTDAERARINEKTNQEIARLNEQATGRFEREQQKQLAAQKKTREAMVENERKTIEAMEKWQQNYDNVRIKQLGDELGETLERRKKAEEEEKKLREKTLKEQEEAAAKTLERIQDATADVFYNMFKNVGDGWKNLWSGMKDWALRILAELAARAAMTRIVVPIMTSMTGTGTASAAMGALTGGQGGAGGFNLGGMLQNMPTSSLFSVGGGGGMFSGVTNAVNAWGARTFPSVFSGGVPLAGPTQSGAPLMSSGASLMGTIGSVAGIAGGIYQMSQGGTGNTVAGAGTAIGSGLMMIPGWGTIAGAIVIAASQIAGALLGNEEHSPSIVFQKQDTPWGATSGYKWHSKDKAPYKMGASIADALGQMTGPLYEEVEGVLSGYGDKYVDMLKGATVTWGRKAGGKWKEWDFGDDMNLDELMGKAMSDLKGQIYKAAGPAFTRAGRDFADSEATASARSLLSGRSASRFAWMEQQIRSGSGGGDVEQYIKQLEAFKTTVASINAAWSSISSASAQVLEPLSQYEQAQRQLNAQYDGWIAQLTALGVAQENVSKIEQGRKDALAKLAEENASAIQRVVDTSAQAVAPLTEMAAAQRQVNAQFDGLAAQLRNLGAAAEYAAQVEANRQAALAAAAQAQAQTIYRAQAELSGNVDQYELRRIAQRYKWDEKYISKNGQINRANVQRDAIDWFKSASAKSVQEAAAGHKTTESQIIRDIKYLDDYFKRQDEAARPKPQPKSSDSAPRAERLNTAVDRTTSEFERLTRALLEYRRRTLSEEKGGLSRAGREQYTRQEFERIFAAARAGDKEAAANLTAAADAYAESARQSARTQSEYALTMGGILDAVQQVARIFGKKAGLPGFASGGLHAGGLRIVGEHGPELEATGPSRIWSAAQTRGILAGNGGGFVGLLLEEVRQLRRQLMAAHGAIAQHTLDSAKVLRRWNGEGLPAVRTA